MAQFLPYSGTNSIQEVVIGIHFQSNFNSEQIKQTVDSIKSDLIEEFPSFNEIHKIPNIKIHNGRILEEPSTAILTGFEALKIKGDGNPARRLCLLEDIFTVNYLVYSGWNSILDDSIRYLNLVLPSLRLDRNPVQAYSLRYIDRYSFDGTPDKSNIAMLFQYDNSYMTSRCFDSGHLWHCNSGWYDMSIKPNKILNQLNVQSVILDQYLTVSVDHNAVCYLETPRQAIESIFDSHLIDFGVQSALNYLHDCNRSVLIDILKPEMLKRIGL